MPEMPRAPAAKPVARRAPALTAALARERQINAALLEVGAAIGAGARLDDVLELILAKARDALGADRATLYLVEEASGDLVSRIPVGDRVEAIRVPAGRGVSGAVVKKGAPVRVKDAYRDRRFLRMFDKLTGYRTRTILSVPMRNHQKRVIGVLQALNKRDGEFTDDDERTLVALATQGAVIIDNSRLHLGLQKSNEELVETAHQLHVRVRHLDLLLTLETAMAQAGTLDDLLRAALREALRATSARAGAVLLRDEDTGEPTLHFLSRADKSRLRRLVVHAGDGFIGRVEQSSTPGFTRGHAGDPSEKKLDDAFGFETRSAVGAPLEGQGAETIGAIALYNRDEREAFDDEDMKLLRLIAANVSTALQLYLSRKRQEKGERLSTIGRLLSSVIHDLKTPMTVISGYVQLSAGTDDPVKRHEYAELVQKQFDLIRSMQSEVLAFARGEKSLLVRRVYLAMFLEQVARSFAAELADHRVTLTTRADDRRLAYFDEGKVTRALHNLVRNSIEALGERGGHIEIAVRREAGAVVFSVRDDGPGIPKAVEARLFDSFVTSGKKGGTGLGLAAVKKIVEEHGGRVSAETSPGGTTFSFTLPQGDAR
ncbi:MAG: GAF domain-containing protein [Polyangiaceae bacterium]|nr:GAF domain-containing protein [Polyangiaceae bacterium]